MEGNGRLPQIALPTGEVEIDGHSISFRSLSRSEALRLGEYVGREDEAEDFLVSCGIDISIEEAHEWRQRTDPITGGLLVNAIIELSGLSDNAVPKGA